MSVDDTVVLGLNSDQLMKIAVVVALIVLSGMAAGLTIGFFSLDTLHLQVLSRAGTETEKKRATRVLSILKRHHHLLVTLLLWNAAVNEMLPVFLEELVPAYIAIILSVTAVLFFGEIIPQALCARHALAICSFVAPFIQVMMWVLAVAAVPIAYVLDRIVGEEQHKMFKREELREVLRIHAPVANVCELDTSVGPGT
eukprot:PhM_4_TR6318/c0_g1_i1/m.48271/K16302/CNNM; metal transporter CNNM